MFLLRDGSLILMDMASLMVLSMFCVSLPTMEKLSTLVSWPVVLAWSHMGNGPWDVTWTFPLRSLQIPLCTPHYTPTVTLIHVNYSAFLCDVILVLGATMKFLMVFLPCNGLGPPCCWKCSWSFCSYSLCSSCALEQTVLALCVSVLNTLCLVDRLWWLSQWRYWSAWVSFL